MEDLENKFILVTPISKKSTFWSVTLDLWEGSLLERGHYELARFHCERAFPAIEESQQK